MLKSYLITAIRSFLKEPTYSIIVLLGLTIGITCSLLLALWIDDEISYDQFHKDKDKLYRVTAQAFLNNSALEIAAVPRMVGNTTYYDNLDKVKGYVRLTNREQVIVEAGSQTFFEDQMRYADSSFFKIFSFKLLQGDPLNCLSQKGQIVLTRTLALKYFGTTDIVGRTIKVNRQEILKVSGVAADPPEQSHLKFSALISFASYPKMETDLSRWGRFQYSTYLLMKEPVAAESFQPQLDSVYTRYMEPIFRRFDGSCRLFLQPITDIHLYSNLLNDSPNNGDINAIYIFAAVAIFFILMASINYTNMATARASLRMKEIGIRKVVGSHRKELMVQFMVESLALAVFAVLLAIALADLLTPIFNNITGKSLSLSNDFGPTLLLKSLSIVLAIGVLGGLYPAVFLSRFDPVQVLKGDRIPGNKNARLRKMLVLFQFVVALFMLLSTQGVSRQVKYMQSTNKGWATAARLVTDLKSAFAADSLKRIANRFATLEGVKSITSGNFMPGYKSTITGTFETEDNKGNQERVFAILINADTSYVNTTGLTLVKGRNYIATHPVDSVEEILVNQTMVKNMGWTNPIGMQLRYNFNKQLNPTTTGIIVGIVKDFTTSNIKEQIQPVIIAPQKQNQLLMAALEPEKLPETLQNLQKAWQSVLPNTPFTYYMVQDRLQESYVEDERASTLFKVFSAVIILIAIMGLYGLASFTTLRRAKEIGIRKAAGASRKDILILVSKDYVTLVATAAIVAAPLAWLFLQSWLNNFAYKYHPGPIGFLLWTIMFAGIILLFTLLSVSRHTLRIAAQDPVTAIKRQ